jgi:hypothetical protein
LPILFALTLFLSATLLFLVQPMIAKMILPLLGGTPAVWNTCMVFFQAALLCGYASVHTTTAWLGSRRQILLQVVLLALPALVLPIGVAGSWVPPADANPIPWLLGLLLVSAGLPFLVVSTTAPLLQKWFAGTAHASARDPYFLYAASNLGSMVALLSYPVLVEPNLTLAAQTELWAVGYAVLAALVLGCALVAWRGASAAPASAPPSADTAPAATRCRLPASRRLRWVLLAFVPSSLMLSVTTYLTTDIAAIPLLWVIPLAIYLLTFILVFARRQLLPHALLLRLFPLLMVLLILAMLRESTEPGWLVLLLHLLTFFVVAMVCHGELAHDRPPVTHLTEFYLWLASFAIQGTPLSEPIAPTNSNPARPRATSFLPK